GQSLAQLLDHTSPDAISRWMYHDVSASALRDYLYQKSIYPASIPLTDDELDIEQALARQLIQMAVRKALSSFPAKIKRYGNSLVPWFEPIVASGSVLTQAPNTAQSMLMLLDGIQPTGVTTVVLDQSHITPGLGAAAAINPVLAVQVLETGTLQNLGTVISPIGKARFGSPVLRVRMVHEDGNETPLEVKQGSIAVLPLPTGQSAKLHLTPLQRFDVGMGGPGRGGGLRVVGGALGVVIDARGRPLRVPDDPARRRELIHRWRLSLGG
ncbi:MAG: glutamate mutase L, partial [Anaerolineales bacterium]